MRALGALSFAFLAATILAPLESSAESWALPASIRDSNTSVSFEVDSTWHLVQGKTSLLSGSIRQRDPADPLSIEVDLAIPVSSFNTDWESRDSKLAEVMAAGTFKEVRFRSSKLQAACHPLRVAKERHCAGALEGILTIRDVTRPVSLPVEVVRTRGKDTISGKLIIRWVDYNVEDPSILIAKLDPFVTISYSIEVPLR